MPPVPSISAGIDSLRLEGCLTVIAIALAFVFPYAGARIGRRVERWFMGIARRKSLAVITVGLTALALRVALLPIIPIPVPGVHDEFSHLLGADTFMHGRLTNQTPPLWAHFESFHIDVIPTYSSMYPPAQDLILALGTLLGHPWIGVLLSASLMCAAICWMLQAWLPPGWALLGGLLAVLRLATFSYWIDSYWGGAPAALGGALMLGALPRIMRKPSARDALILAAGLALLANSRPYEGLLAATPVALMLIIWMARRIGSARTIALRRVVAPLAIALTLLGVAMGYYNWRVFGSPLTMPYQVNRAMYAVTPYFVWQSPRPTPEYRNDRMRWFYTVSEREWYDKERSVAGFLSATWGKVEIVARGFLLVALVVPFVMVHRAVRDRRIRFLVWVSVVACVGVAVEVFAFPHYVAPMTVLIYALLLQSMRHLRVWTWRGRPVGVQLVRSLVIVCVMMIGARAAAGPLHITPTIVRRSWDSAGPGNVARANLLKSLEASGERHLVIVRYRDVTNVHVEWVYNGADIEHAQVIWARDLGEDKNRELIATFGGRRVWLLQPEATPLKLSPYPDR